MVDDDEDVRRLAVDEPGSGRRVTTSRPPLPAPNAWPPSRDDVPDVVILDVMMPVMDGPATLERSADDPRIHACRSSSSPPALSRRTWIACAALPVAGVLQKPFDPLTLPGDVAALLGW